MSDDERTSRECSSCGRMNPFDATQCRGCKRMIGDRAHPSQTFPAMAVTLEALVASLGVVLDDGEAAAALVCARQLVEDFNDWQKNPPPHALRNERLCEAARVAAILRDYRARH